MLKWVVHGSSSPTPSQNNNTITDLGEYYNTLNEKDSCDVITDNKDGCVTCRDRSEVTDEESEVTGQQGSGDEADSGFVVADDDEEEEGEDDVMGELPNKRFIRGSDPLIQTVRGKLQQRRSKLNEQINRELRMRTGAENLYKATANRKMRDTVGLELSFVNSNLQLLKEELSELNSSVSIYQNRGTTQSVPMIPLGLKETKDVDFASVLKEYILEHYYEDGSWYQNELKTVNELRQACRTPVRNETGVQLLFEYYGQLFYVEKRFFRPKKNLGIYFEWFDSLTGIPNTQRTVGFEKGSILFNIGALYTQIGARQDRSKLEGIESAIEHFQYAAGTFWHLRDSFSHAPSMDMQPQTLDMLMQLMLAQAQECVFEKCVLGGLSNEMSCNISAAHEAAMVSALYCEVNKLMTDKKIKDYVPFSWVSMTEVKQHYYSSLAHYHTSVSVHEHSTEPHDQNKMADLFSDLHVSKPVHHYTQHTTSITDTPQTTEERKVFELAHLRQSILANEEALRLHGLSKQLRKIDTLQQILRHTHDRSFQLFSDLEEEDDFTELTSVPAITAKTTRKVIGIPPDFAKYKVNDIFIKLGPVAVFSARHDWTAPRLVELKRHHVGEDYGFSLRGEEPVIVAEVDIASLAERVGIQKGDFVLAVGRQDVKWSSHEEVVTLMRDAGNHLVLRLITPTDCDFLQGSVAGARKGTSAPGTPTPTRMHDSLPSAGRRDKDKTKIKSGTSSWTLRKRSRSVEKKSRFFVSGNSKV